MHRHLTLLTRTAGSILAGSLLLAHPACAQDRLSNPPELGRIDWSRDFDAAATSAKKESKPILLLFQEVPG
jgi:hypothetical protein